MKTSTPTLVRCALAGALIISTALCAAQTSNTVVAQFGSAPSAGQAFTIDLVNSPASDVAGFAFKLIYDPAQVDITGVKDNTGDSDAKVQYTLGPQAAAPAGAVAPAAKILAATTLKEIKGATNLVEIQLVKKPGFAPPLKFSVEDRMTGKLIDGLQGADLKNIPHEFNTSAVNQ